MQVKPNPMTVGDFAESVQSGNITINRDYQRGGGLWPYRAKCALIETILKGFPMPAIFLHQRFDPDARKPFRDIVDGQQRTDAIRSFVEGDLRLSSKMADSRLRGKKFSELDKEEYESFVTYSLPVFLFTDATDADVRAAFRRINSHTNVLNAEEKRHSRFQGTMKWFVVDLSNQIQETLKGLGVFSKTQLLRMQDARLVTEILYAVVHGIKTTKGEQLDQLYAEHDEETSLLDFDGLRRDMVGALDTVASWRWLPQSPFTKSYQFFCMLVAVMHAHKSFESLETIAAGGRGLRSEEQIESRMAVLIQALDISDELIARSEHAGQGTQVEPEASDERDDEDARGDIDPRLQAKLPFVLASRTMTNTEDTRRVRFLTFLEAVSKG